VSAVTLWLGVRAGDAVGVKAIVLVGVGVAIEEGGLAQDVSKARKRSIEMTQVRLTSIKTFLIKRSPGLRFQLAQPVCFYQCKKPSSYSINVSGMLEVA